MLLPCNVVVYEDDDGKVVVAALDPAAALEIVDNPKIKPAADEVKARIERVIGQMAG